MSRIRVVGGSITKTSKGATTIEVLDGNFVSIAAKQNIWNGGENGVTHHEYVAPEKKEEKPTDEEKVLDAKCIVQFRPSSGWGGQFGFDWFRTGDTGRKGDLSYETLIGQYYDKAVTDATKQINTNGNKWTANFKADPQPTEFIAYNRIQKLKELYGIYKYSLGNDKSGNPVNKEYYKPVIALFATEPDPLNQGKFIETGKAKLDLYIEFEQQGKKEIRPSKLIFEMDGVLMDEKHPLVSIDKHTILENKLKNKIEIEITCKAEFAADKDIKVWAISIDSTGNQTAKLQAGVLKMIAPAKKRTKNIVVVLVKTSLGTGENKKIDTLKKNLKQALVKPNIVTEVSQNGILEEVTIDLTIASNNVYNTDFNTVFGVNSNKYGNITKASRLEDTLLRTLSRDYPGQFDDHFKLFFFRNSYQMVLDSTTSEPISFTRGFSARNTNHGLMFWGHDEDTIAHECLHGLGLPHSFWGESTPNNTFCYQAQKTDNIMDYSHNKVDIATGVEHSKTIDRIATWYWQWKIINNL